MLTIASVTAATGDLMVVCVAGTGLAGDPTVEWNGETLTQLFNVPAAFSNHYIYAKKIAAGGTHSLTITHTFSATRATAATVSTVSGISSATPNQSTWTGGTGTDADSGDVTLTSGNVPGFTAGLVGTNGPSGDAAGTWASPLGNGQRVGTTGGTADSNVTVSEGFLENSTAGATRAEKTGMTSRDWAAGVANFK